MGAEFPDPYESPNPYHPFACTPDHYTLPDRLARTYPLSSHFAYIAGAVQETERAVGFLAERGGEKAICWLPKRVMTQVSLRKWKCPRWLYDLKVEVDGYFFPYATLP